MGQTLIEIANSAHLIVHKVVPLSMDGKSQLRVEFENKPHVRGQYDMSGWILLDPTHGYVLDEYEVRNTDPTLPGYSEISFGKVLYETGAQGDYFPKEIIHSTRYPDKPIPFNYRLHFNCTLPEVESFTRQA